MDSVNIFESYLFLHGKKSVLFGIAHSEDFVDIVLFFKGRARPYSINV